MATPQMNPLPRIFVVILAAFLSLQFQESYSFTTLTKVRGIKHNDYKLLGGRELSSSPSSSASVMMSAQEDDAVGGYEENMETDEDLILRQQQEALAKVRAQQEAIERMRLEQNQQKRLDPLVRSVTRTDQVSDEEGQTINVPLLGELELDRNSFIFFPVAAFAVLGFVNTLFVAYSARDAFVDAMVTNLEETNERVLQQGSPQNRPIDEGCRGLCGSQDKSLDDLRAFYNQFGKAETPSSKTVDLPSAVFEAKEEEIKLPEVVVDNEETTTPEETLALKEEVGDKQD